MSSLLAMGCDECIQLQSELVDTAQTVVRVRVLLTEAAGLHLPTEQIYRNVTEVLCDARTKCEAAQHRYFQHRSSHRTG